MPTYRLHDTTGDDLGLIEHSAPNLEPGDVAVLADGREALVTARVEAEAGPFAALLEIAIAPTPLTERRLDQLVRARELPAHRGAGRRAAGRSERSTQSVVLRTRESANHRRRRHHPRAS